MKKFINLRFPKHYSLKKRIVLLFAFGTLFPLLVTTVFAYETMSSLLTNKMNGSYRANLQQTMLSLEHTMVNLNHVSQQLTAPGSLGVKLNAYLLAESPYDRGRLYKEFNNEFNVVIFSNPGVGLTMYFVEEDGQYLFNNYGVKDTFDPHALPVLANHHKITNFGPHKSMQRYNDQFVLSTIRPVDIPDREDVYVYMESAMDLTKDILNAGGDQGISYLMLDSFGRVTYSEGEASGVYPLGTSFEEGQAGVFDGHHWFKETSEQGWSLVSFVPDGKYNQEKASWLLNMTYVVLFFILFSLLLAWLLWLMVYRPLRRFDAEIRSVSNKDLTPRPVMANVPEFDQLLQQMQQMKRQVLSLLQQVEHEEKQKAKLEVQKLMYQINPHFLMNTLDTIRWMAWLNGEKEIDRNVQSLIKLLSHNLGKRGELTTLTDELMSVTNYLKLQQIRYDVTFEVSDNLTLFELQQMVPRFILQPLAENALYHGVQNKGHITIHAMRKGNTISVTVVDKGQGISREKQEELLSSPATQGMGIGMQYVRRVLDHHYDGNARLVIESELGKGTTVTLFIPVERREEIS
ncbi:sensor histidine kinase [Aureibacillus halotolerans]|uniref:histidine kinase n=1 Tax=Aureibacillus halotolerans TaxID=1508390 RepID=A0A4V3D489_9BACI|nr:sensor histidine kinase [Aureibacillus halotolerans]TDQ33715.1 two-component system sensor histidine kinase YesM [Aureibacillus halotolerans]